MNANQNIPRHIAIIMDGNGRWAQSHGNERVEGHKSGVDSVRSVVREAGEIGVEYLTIYAFSSENWNRPQTEVDALMHLFTATITMEIEALTANGVKLHFIGDIAGLPIELQKIIENATAISPEKIKLNLIIAINYSSRNEIAQAVKNIAIQLKTGNLTETEITPELISQNLYTKNIPDPDLLIRTSGEQRISNFLLYQISYSELYFTQTLWPDFDAKQLNIAIEEYQKRQRRFGAL